MPLESAPTLPPSFQFRVSTGNAFPTFLLLRFTITPLDEFNFFEFASLDGIFWWDTFPFYLRIPKVGLQVVIDLHNWSVLAPRGEEFSRNTDSITPGPNSNSPLPIAFIPKRALQTYNAIIQLIEFIDPRLIIQTTGSQNILDRFRGVVVEFQSFIDIPSITSATWKFLMSSQVQVFLSDLLFPWSTNDSAAGMKNEFGIPHAWFTKFARRFVRGLVWAENTLVEKPISLVHPVNWVVFAPEDHYGQW